jgi:hypothetical protein
LITVIDALMGQGKTRHVFAHMNENKDERYIYIGVNLGEIARCQKACAALDMRDPVPQHGRKFWDLITLVGDGCNVAARRGARTGLPGQARQ